MIGGEVAMRVSPRIMADLAAPMDTVIVSGTNGKSTTTRMVRAALETRGPVASNTNGDNMASGVITALMNAPRAPFAALEVDEMHLPAVAGEVNPEVLVLLNLSRDQLDRVGEISSVELRLRQAVEDHPNAIIIANCDDPLIVSAACSSSKVVWVAAGAGWGADSIAYPRGGRVLWENGTWRLVPAQSGGALPELCERPRPDWWLDDIDLSASTPKARLNGPDGVSAELALALPGRANLSNAAQAVAAAAVLGVSPQAAADAICSVHEVAGRYSIYEVDGRQARIMLAKNPAGWQETMTMIDPEVKQVVIGVNGQIPDGQDLSWLWDVDFGALARTSDEDGEPIRVVACGERGADLAVRLEYANIHTSFVKTPMEALAACEPGRVEMLLNYTALRDFKTILDAREARK
mgnify:FL=1